MLNPDTRASDGYRISHQAAGAGIDYDKAFEPGYCAEFWQKIEKPLLETMLRPLGGGERTALDFGLRKRAYHEGCSHVLRLSLRRRRSEPRP